MGLRARKVQYYLGRRENGVPTLVPRLNDVVEGCICSAELLKVALGDQALDIALANIELAVLGEVDSSAALSANIRMPRT